MDYNRAVELLGKGEGEKVKEFFRKEDYPLEYAYSLFLTGNLDYAQVILRDIESTRADWLLKLISAINGCLTEYPTYFQIRNFLEIDVSMMLLSGQNENVQKIINISNIFQGINSETYKCLGRVLLKHNYLNSSKAFLDKSLDDYYNDVELHYLFVEYYLQINDLKNAKESVEKCLKINPKYYPALRTEKLLKTHPL